MKKKTITIVIASILVLVCGAKSLTDILAVYGSMLHTVQSDWLIADSETSAGTEATALSETERTKQKVEALIIAAASGDDEISVFEIPGSWNGVRFRAMGITDNGTLTHEIYLGSRGGTDDCEVTYAAQLAWTVGTQTATYSQIDFTSGGTYVPKPGDKIIGNTSEETAVIVSISALSSGTWAGGDAAGTITYRSDSGTFTSSETITIRRDQDNKTVNGYTHAASDLIRFEMADTLVNTAKSWGKIWTTTSPADNTNAETWVDVVGADFMVIVTTTCSADGKLLVKGF